MKRITRNRHLTKEEAAKYDKIREQVDKELPELIDRQHERMAAQNQLQDVVSELKASREAMGLSLADMAQLTGMDRSALSRLETGNRENPTVATLIRYAVAVGKTLKISLTEIAHRT